MIGNLPLQPRRTPWSALLLCGLLLLPFVSLRAQLGLAGRNSPDFRLNLLRTEVETPHGQQPPYEWSAAYLEDASSNVQPGSVFLLDSSVCGFGVPNTNQFGEEFKVYYSYDNDGFLSEVIYRQETSPGVYENYSKKVYSYSAGKRTSYLYQVWDGSSSSWMDDYEELTTYNNEGRQETFMIREVDMSGQWDPLFRETRAYNPGGHVTEVLSAKWDNTTWLDTARKEIVYNAIGFYTELYDESWNGGGWDTLTRESAVYDNLGMIWEGYQFDRKTANGYSGIAREVYQYDQYGFWTGMVRQTWDTVSNEWENILKETYNYSRSGLWKNWKQEVYADTSWVNNIRQAYFKTGSVREDVMQKWDTVSGTWNHRFRVLTRFDSVSNLEQEAGIQAWNDGIAAWRNTDKSRLCTHSWSQVSATGIEPQLPDLNCTLTNPYRVYEPIRCDELLPGKTYDVRLMDMQGRTVYRKAVPGGDIFSVDHTLPTGVYHLSIFENQQLRFLRKIMINP